MKLLKHCIILVFLFIQNIVFAGEFSIPPSFRIFPNDNLTQTEPIIVVSPLNPLVMFCSAFTIDTFFTASYQKSEGIYVTTNGGLNWFGNDRCNGADTGNHGGDPGIVIDKNGVFILYHVWNSFNPYATIFTHYSTNMGTTWSNGYPLYPATQLSVPEDKGTITTDNSPSSPYYGRSYASWVIYFGPFPPVNISYSTNSGVSWSTYDTINPNPQNRCSGGDVKTGPDGTVYDTWAGVSASSPFTELFAGFASSTNGGVSWNVNQNIFTMHGITGFLPQKNNIRVNGIPRMVIDFSSGPRRGWIYIVTNEINNSPAGSDPDIIFHRSTNGGQTWSQGIRVNQDAVNNGKIQYFPAICVDSTGAINVLYYDDRNTTSDSSQVYISRSTTGGDTWYDFQVSDKTFQPKAVSGGAQYYQGDFIGITSTRNKLFPVWMAKYGIKYQIWTTIIDIDLIGIKKISSDVPSSYELKQNYPNPFNPKTIINFQLPMFSNVKLIIYDILGREVTTLVNGQFQPGSYEVTWDAAEHSSGIYFYELTTDNFKETRKMVLSK